MTSARQVARVAIASPYPSVRAGLRAMLTPLEAVEVVADIIGGDLDPSDAVDVLVIDIAQGELAEFEHMSTTLAHAAIVALVDDSDAGRRVLTSAGRPIAILSREAGPSEISAAVLGVLSGLIVLDPTVAPMDTKASPLTDYDQTLTERERQVIELVALGLPNKSIAVELGISEHTVKFHVASILDKLDAASRTEAVAIAARHGLLAL
ncbi:MAG: response regulator transcription factor [Thermomicrobiales bacterium]|nr:response regulator transcription factor [Thermomicrobiales bacterium]